MNFENIINKARENPEANQKVKGKTLLELEEEITRCKEKIEQQAKDLYIATTKLAKTEKHILRFANLLSYADTDLEQTSKEKETLNKELSEIKVKKSDIGNSLEETTQNLEIANKKLEYYSISHLEMKKELTEKDKTLASLLNEFKLSIVENNEDMKGVINDLAQIISNKEAIISALKQDMNQTVIDKNKEIEEAINELTEKISDYDDVINKLENDLEIKTKQLENVEASFEFAFIEKDKVNKKLKSRLGAKIKTIDDLTNRVDELEEKVLETHKSDKILEEIRNLMLTKGFINDKEFEKLCKEIEKQSFMIFY